MPTRPCRRVFALLMCALAWSHPASAQVKVDVLTEVRHLTFSGAHALSQHRLEKLMQTRARGPGYGLRVALGKLPLVPPPAAHPFSPLTLQEDVVRLRAAYAASGFFHTRVHYEVERDQKKNLLDITMIVEEGPPTLVRDVTVKSSDSLSTLPVPKGEEKSWEGVQRSTMAQMGHRLVVDDARQAGIDDRSGPARLSD